MTPAPSTYHQIVSSRLEWELFKLREKELGEVLHSPIDVYFSETETYQPDILFIAEARFNIIAEDKIEGAPDLIMEILSPSTAYYDLKVKKRVYAKSGVREYWVIDPIEKSIEIYENKENSFFLADKALLEVESSKGSSVCSHIFTSLEISLETIFQ